MGKGAARRSWQGWADATLDSLFILDIPLRTACNRAADAAYYGVGEAIGEVKSAISRMIKPQNKVHIHHYQCYYQAIGGPADMLNEGDNQGLWTGFEASAVYVSPSEQ